MSRGLDSVGGSDFPTTLPFREKKLVGVLDKAFFFEACETRSFESCSDEGHEPGNVSSSDSSPAGAAGQARARYPSSASAGDPSSPPACNRRPKAGGRRPILGPSAAVGANSRRAPSPLAATLGDGLVVPVSFFRTSCPVVFGES